MIEAKGAAKREQAGYGDDSGSGSYGGSNDNKYQVMRIEGEK